MTDLPWDDPDRDVVADMIETTARWIAAPGQPDERDVHTAASFIRRAFWVSDQSISEAMRTISRAYGPALQDLAERTTRTGNIDLTRRRPMYGDRITHHDLDVDQRRIGAAFEALLDESRRVVHLHTRADVQWYCELDYRLHRQVDVSSMARGAGKATRMAADLKAWAEEFERVNGEKPETRGWVTTDPDWVGVDDLVAEMRADAEREDRRWKLIDRINMCRPSGPPAPPRWTRPQYPVVNDPDWRPPFTDAY